MEDQLIHSTNVYSMYSVCQAESHTTERAMASAVEKLTAIKLGRYIYIYTLTQRVGVWTPVSEGHVREPSSPTS